MWLEANRSDRFGVPVEAEQFLLRPFFIHPQVPHFDSAIIRAGDY